ncbi:hypothetical protein AVEN_16182-1 [Araneus ventricosus]|uniref:Uncharacterized protein n=1 Tax=Araneus ventricosus TaxID=182803 RepID=A0A4Y2IWR2_ARAVE|nr:hypothetical protein AVEN_16182-1 [Araneus ventricosus]
MDGQPARDEVKGTEKSAGIDVIIVCHQKGMINSGRLISLPFYGDHQYKSRGKHPEGPTASRSPTALGPADAKTHSNRSSVKHKGKSNYITENASSERRQNLIMPNS